MKGVRAEPIKSTQGRNGWTRLMPPGRGDGEERHFSGPGEIVEKHLGRKSKRSQVRKRSDEKPGELRFIRL